MPTSLSLDSRERSSHLFSPSSGPTILLPHWCLCLLPNSFETKTSPAYASLKLVPRCALSVGHCYCSNVSFLDVSACRHPSRRLPGCFRKHNSACRDAYALIVLRLRSMSIAKHIPLQWLYLAGTDRPRRRHFSVYLNIY
jgi:hypothetical protein